MESNKTADYYDYSFEQLKVAAKRAMITGMLTQSVSAGGKTISFGSVAEARETYRFAVEMTASESGSDGGFALLRNP
jgi:hypothetical protein